MDLPKSLINSWNRGSCDFARVLCYDLLDSQGFDPKSVTWKENWILIDRHLESRMAAILEFWPIVLGVGTQEIYQVLSRCLPPFFEL